MFRNYARIDANNMYVEFYPGRAYDSEALDWQPGDPSRIGLEMPIVEWQPSWIIAALVDVTDMDPQPQYGWIYNAGTGLFSAPPGPSQEELAFQARLNRDQLLKSVYDPGINMALRALRMAGTPEAQSYAEGKIIELDNYAQALEGVPEQQGFPQTIDWPVAPTK